MRKILMLGITIFAFFLIVSGCGKTVLAADLTLRDQRAIQTYQQAKQEYAEAVFLYQKAREDFLLAREKLQILRTAAQIQETLEGAKNFLLRADQAAIKYLTMVKKKVEGAYGLTEDEKQASLDEIERDISWLLGKQAEIKKVTTKTELITLTKEVKDRWQKIRRDAKRITGQILASRANNVLTKLEEAGQRIETAINKAKTNGRATSQLEVWLSDYRKNLNLAREKHQAARAKFAAISSLEEANIFFPEGTTLIKEANQYLRQAHQNLKEIVRELKRS